MAIAYLLLAHTDPSAVRRICLALQSDGAAVFLHVDAKVEAAPFLRAVGDLPWVKAVENRVRVYWGGWSQVEATLALINAAKAAEVKFDRYVLLSGGCYPLKSNEFIKCFFHENSFEYITARQMPDDATHKYLDRITRFTFEGGYREPGILALVIRILNRVCRVFPARSLSPEFDYYRPYGGSNWWALTANAVDEILGIVAGNPELVKRFKHTKMPDEVFFQTIIANSRLRDRMRDSITYADWSHPTERPRFLSEEHLELLFKNGIPDRDGEHQPYLFGRKFDSRNSHLVERIERLRNDP